MRRVRIELSYPPGPDPDDAALYALAARALGIRPEELSELTRVKRALDARRGRPSWQLTVDLTLARSPKKRPGRLNLRPPPEAPPRLKSPLAPKEAPPVIVVGAGPAGLFAAWHLAESGARVTLLERGAPVEERAMDARRLRQGGRLDPDSNLCFGEGGAGTFSDGKLTCRRKDPLTREVLLRLVEAGAPEQILIEAKPHIGSNRLFLVLKGIRQRLLDLGAALHFRARAERLLLGPAQAVRGLEVQGLGQLEAPRVLLALGHSARDSYEALLAQGLPIEAKPFAVGVRAEHPQRQIDRAQYHLKAERRPDSLPAAEYRLAQTIEGRGVYSFCMCPGGVVVPTPTEPGRLAVNGMSFASRGSRFANSGLVAQVELADLTREGFSGPLAGVEFQRKLEADAFAAGGGGFFAPAARATDFIQGRASSSLPESRYRPGLTAAPLHELLPVFVREALSAALLRFDHKIRGYASESALLIGVESRTSSPLSIPRDKTRCEVPGYPGLFVAGEGPGYAGGIMSAAMDGLRVSQAVLQDMQS